MENLFMIKSRNAFFIAIGLCISLLNNTLPVDADTSNTNSFIQEMYLKKFPITIPTAEETSQAQAKKQKIQTQLPFWPIAIPEESFTKQNILKTFIETATPEKINSKINPIISYQAIEKLNLLAAKTSDTENKSIYTDGFTDKMANLADCSLLGKVAFAHELTNPTTNLAEIKEKQGLIKCFMSNNLDPIRNFLRQASLAEEHVAYLFAKNNEIIPDLIKQQVYWSNGFFTGAILPAHVNHYLDRMPITLVPKIFELPLEAIVIPLVSLSTTFSYAGAKSIYKGTGKEFFSTCGEVIKTAGQYVKNKALNPTQSTKELAWSVKNMFLEGKTTFNSLEVPQKALCYYLLHVLGMLTYNIEHHMAHLQTYFISLASFLNQAQAIATFFKTNNMQFPLAFPELQTLIDIDDKTKHSADFNQLIDILKTGTFRGTSSLFSYLGRVKTAYKLFMNIKHEFGPILYAMGKLQMYNSIAKLMNKSATKENTFCFAEFVDHGPYIEAINFWNPMVGQDNAVSNSLMMTPAEKDIILHGPNTGGKTTTIKGLLYNILLAQTLGIGCASRLVLSPFSQINCFMDIQDDVSAGSSLFDSEVRFATALHNNVQSLKQDEYAFTIADEILRSTSPSKGQACAYQFTKKLAKNPNSMSITVTHYPKLVELATETPNNGFRTFHVEIKRENGKVIRTFKLKEGATSENIAGDILQEHGIFDDADLKEVERLEQSFLD